MAKEILYHNVGIDPYFKVWHTTGKNMIIYIYEGSGGIVCSEKTLPITKGILCFIGSERYHYTMPEKPEVYDRSKIFISNERLLSLLSLLPNESQLRRKFTSESLVYAQISGEDVKEVESLIDSLAVHEGRENFDAILLSVYIRLLAFIDENHVDSVSPNTGFLIPAIEYVNAHISEEIKIDDVCAVVHISKYHFCREFKKMTGQTFMEYLLDTRVVLAKKMLAKDRLGVGEISARCGFSSVSYFCRVFKDKTGRTPLAFRKSSVR